MGLTLNWFSPVPPTPSSIALDTAAVMPVLAKEANITLWVHEAVWTHDLEAHARVRRYDPTNVPWAEINAADLTIYHLGNHAEFHGPIWQVSRQHPGVVILHDFNLQHLFAGLVLRNLGLKADEYREMMRFHHPDGGSEVAEAVLLEGRSADEVSEHCPLTGVALENALSVGVHSEVARLELEHSTNLPVAYIPLFVLPEEPVDGSAQTEPETSPNDRIYRIIIFGFLGANRRLEVILKALRDFPQRNRFHLDIYGTLPDDQRIRQTVRTFGLTDVVTIHGFVPALELNAALSRSDLALNLRDPSMGEASASQLRIWQHNLPSLVTDVGWYATLPKNTVAFVRRHLEVEDIQAHLANFLREPRTYRELGRHGRKYVEEHHSVEAYVSALLQLVDLTLRRKSQQAVFWMAGRSGRVLHPWFTASGAGILLHQLAQTISQLFDQPPTTTSKRGSAVSGEHRITGQTDQVA